MNSNGGREVIGSIKRREDAKKGGDGVSKKWIGQIARGEVGRTEKGKGVQRGEDKNTNKITNQGDEELQGL